MVPLTDFYTYWFSFLISVLLAYSFFLFTLSHTTWSVSGFTPISYLQTIKHKSASKSDKIRLDEETEDKIGGQRIRLDKITWNLVESHGTCQNIGKGSGMFWNVLEVHGTSWKVKEHGRR